VEEYRPPELTRSSGDALKWVVTRAHRRASSKDGSPDSVSSADLLVGILLAHPDRSEPHQLFEHLHLPLKRLYDTLRTTSGFALDDKPKGPEPLDPMPALDTEAEIVLEKVAARDGWVWLLTVGWLVGLHHILIQRWRCAQCGHELVSDDQKQQAQARRVWWQQVCRLIGLSRFKLGVSVRRTQ
jgi:hypothetical protein